MSFRIWENLCIGTSQCLNALGVNSLEQIKQIRVALSYKKGGTMVVFGFARFNFQLDIDLPYKFIHIYIYTRVEEM